jgi:glycosyltransferase 2 family protein
VADPTSYPQGGTGLASPRWRDATAIVPTSGLFNRRITAAAIPVWTVLPDGIARSALKPYQGGTRRWTTPPRAYDRTTPSADEMRQILLSALKILISLALLYLALRKVNLFELASRINLASLGWIGLAIAALFLQILAGALRWCQVSAECDAPLTAWQSVRFNIIGTFFNQTLPSSIGGDAVRLWLLARGGAGWRAATYSIFVDRAIGLIALAIIIVASLPWSLSLINNSDGRSALLVVDFVALAAGLGFLLLGRLRWPWLKSWWLTHHFYACSVITNRVIFSRDRGPTVAVLSILVHVLAVVIAWCVVKAIAAPILFSQTFELVPPVMLITMLPISIAGWGVREATMGLAFGYAGLATNEGVNVSLLFGAVSFIVGAIGGLVWIFSAEKAAKGAKPIEVPSEVAE